MRHSPIILALAPALAWAAPANPQVTGTCLPYAAGVNALKSVTFTSTITASTSTITASTGTITQTADASSTTLDQVTIIAQTSTAYTTVFTTTVITTASYTGRQCGGPVKRGIQPAQKKVPNGCPSALKSKASSYIASACKCMHLPTPTTTRTTTSVLRKTTTPLATTTPLTTATTTPIVTVTPQPATTTPSTTVTVETASTVTVPGVILSHPTAITSVDSDGVAQRDYDDVYFPLTIPFPLQLFGQSSANLFIGINGWVSLTNDPSTEFDNTPLPASALPDTCFVNYWSDLYVYNGTQQGIYYQIDGLEGSRTASFEWYTSTYMTPNGYYHFVSTFYENNPGAVTYDFFQLTPQKPSLNEAFGTVGVQRYDTSQSAQYSFDNNLPVHQNMQVVYNPASNAFTAAGCSD